MAVDEARDAIRLLHALENGGMAPMDAAILAEEIDPVLLHAIVSYLRTVYPASDPAASSVLERVVGLTSSSAAIVRRHREGENDPITRWFEDDLGYTEFRGRGSDMIGVLVDKLES